MENQIRIKTMCLLKNGDKVLVQDCRTVRPRGDSTQGPADYYRVLGGNLNYLEKTEDGIRREIREEIKSEIENLRLLEVFENIYTGKHGEGHEIDYIYKGDLANKALYDQKVIHVIEDSYEFDAVWVPIEELLNGPLSLYPAADWGKYLQG